MSMLFSRLDYMEHSVIYEVYHDFIYNYWSTLRAASTLYEVPQPLLVLGSGSLLFNI